MERKVKKSLFVTVALILTFTVGSFASNDPPIPCEESRSPLLDKIIATSRLYCGTPYRYGGMSKNGMDCSGLLRTVFAVHNLDLPHSSSNLRKLGTHVEREAVQAGDMLFFKGRNLNSKSTGHVALVISVCNGRVEIIHATRRGVVVDVLNDEPYYERRFLEARRVIDYHQMESLCLLFEARMFHLPRIQ